MNYNYSSSIESFLFQEADEIVKNILFKDTNESRNTQREAWKSQISILKDALKDHVGKIFFEFSIPRMGKRLDTLLIIRNVVFVIEFKNGESKYLNHNIDQVWDYALDLKNFHEPSHKASIVPILIATHAKESFLEIKPSTHGDDLLAPLRTNSIDLRLAINQVLSYFSQKLDIEIDGYAMGRYSPTPTIIEAAVALYNTHSVDEITRSDAEAINLTKTSNAISRIIEFAKKERKKVICFVTGVPGAGKTLVGLKVATQHLDKKLGNASVYLSGNAPLVAILQEALARDKVKHALLAEKKVTKSSAKSGVKTFIQIIHHYRDAYLNDDQAPYDHVAIFDEAQRAWNKEQTVKFMRQKKNKPDFDQSEPEFLISCLDRHQDWAVVVCLVGGGQEINTGEAGISEWLLAIRDKFPLWDVYISPHLTDKEYSAKASIQHLNEKKAVVFNEDLHLSVSMRSFRAERLSLLIKNVLDLDLKSSQKLLPLIVETYPIILTRDLNKAKQWLKARARGSERYGIVVSSQAQRLKPFAIDVRSPMDPVKWFLEGKEDVRSSFYLEEVATEFHVQGLELDWVCVTWDGDLRYSSKEWQTFSFKGNRWEKVKKEERKRYLINAYRVLLTRARQGMIIVVPEGNVEDHTRHPEFYDSTFSYLKSIGLPII